MKIREFSRKNDEIAPKLVILTENAMNMSRFPQKPWFLKTFAKKSETELEPIDPRNEPTKYIAKNA